MTKPHDEDASTDSPSFDALIDALAKASVGSLSARVDVEDDADPEHPYTKLAFAINILLSDLEHHEDARQRAAIALAANEEKYRRLVTCIQDGVLFANRDRRIMEMNPALMRMLGYSMEELRGLTTRILYARKEDYESFGKALAKATAAGGPIRQEFLWRTKSGNEIVVDVVASVYTDDRGAATGLVGVIRDVTEQRRMENALEAAYNEMERRVDERTRDLEAANQELTAFNYMVAHDLRVPTRSAEHLAGILAEEHGDDLGDDGMEIVRTLTRSITRMRQLVEDLFTLSGASRGDLEMVDVDVTALAQASFEALLAREASDRQVAFDVQPGLRARADEGLLRAAFDNLLGNALKYTRRTQDARIRVSALPSSQDGKITFSVQDNGAGFDPSQAHAMFRPFQRLHAPSEFEGTGIGLAIVARIVERHGGAAWAQGEPGRGATVFLTLPAASSRMSRPPDVPGSP